MVKKPMFTKLFNQFFGKIVLFILIITFINQCGMYRKTDARKVPVNAKERVKKISKKAEELNLVSSEVKALVILNLLLLMKCGGQQLIF